MRRKLIMNVSVGYCQRHMSEDDDFEDEFDEEDEDEFGDEDEVDDE